MENYERIEQLFTMEAITAEMPVQNYEAKSGCVTLLAPKGQKDTICWS